MTREKDEQGEFWSEVSRHQHDAEVPESVRTRILESMRTLRQGFVYSFARWQDAQVAVPAVRLLVEWSLASKNGIHLMLLVDRRLDDPMQPDMPTPISEVVQAAQAGLDSTTEWESGRTHATV